MKREEFVQELTGHIIPFWNKLRDDENGGFTGFMDSALNIDKKGEKGVILHSRILWFYSNAYIELKDPQLLDNARHAYEFLTEKCVDKEYGGVYWSMNYGRFQAHLLPGVLYLRAFQLLPRERRQERAETRVRRYGAGGEEFHRRRCLP